MHKRKNIAIIGSGISGISAAYFLHKHHNVTIYENEKYFGGHTRTITLNENEKLIDIDTGFIVYNKKTYPNLVKFFEDLDIESEDSDMSLSIVASDIGLEYASKNLLSQINNFSHLKYIKIIKDIFVFYQTHKRKNLNSNYRNLTIEEYFKKHQYSNEFINFHIYPIASSIWSTDIPHIKNFPINEFIEFFISNDLFNLFFRPKWKTLKNKGKSYVQKVLNLKGIKSFNNFHIDTIIRKEKSIFIKSHDYYKKFDDVIIATHADQALKLLDNPTLDEIQILTNYKYNSHQILLHKDSHYMPKNKKLWSSWNFLGQNQGKFSLTYWMNNLQNLKTMDNYFVTVNPMKEISNALIFDSTELHHPIFTKDTINATKKLSLIQGNNQTWFCGSYTGFGHHEDGINSSISIINKMNLPILWNNKKLDN